jgi:uncharacterized repeat protein (TIGR03803 family)
MLCANAVPGSLAQTLTTLVSFTGADGANPYGSLVQVTNGDLYGTTYSGGANGSGTIFKMNPSGALTTVYSFCSLASCADGAYPGSALIQAKGGELYGTTVSGGAFSQGTVFKITPRGALTTVYSFCAQGLSLCADGCQPSVGLVQARNGDFYGTTGLCGSNASGTVFKITAGGRLTTLHSFCSQASCADGSHPYAGLIQATNGNLYGTTSQLGANFGGGTIFEITPSGSLSTLYSFCSKPLCADGFSPLAGLVQGDDGDFYGTTFGGGANTAPDQEGGGTIFKITPAGALTTLYSFCSQPACADGYAPYSTLVQATNGHFYGTTQGGGAGYYYGTIFQIRPGGALTTLYSFCSQTGCADGAYPYTGLIQDTNGELYGLTEEGGANFYDSGTIFSLSVGLGPFVTTQPSSGKAGTPVRILGTNLIGSTSVTFNGTPAMFTVVSASEIQTTVPAGATTGKVAVVTPGDTLSSVRFIVRQ